MTTDRRPSRRRLPWVIVGAVILLAGIAALVIGLLLPRGTVDPTPSPTGTGPSEPTTAPTVSPTDEPEFVDPAVAERGWVPEPVTTDPEAYIRAALAAASTFDTTLSSREDWLTYLDTWFTPDVNYASNEDRETQLAAARLELRQSVVLPESEWDALAAEDGRVVATVDGDVEMGPVPDDASGDMVIGTADVVLAFAVSDGKGGAGEYEESVRVSVQVLCGHESVPTPGSAQRAGDCKVVRFFSEPLEP